MANYTNSPSGNVDEHVVKMTFDNKQFEKNAQQSLDTVEKLKSSMNFEATVKGLDKLEDGVAESNKSLESLNDSVDKIKDKFSNLGIIGVTALQNITNSAINAGKQMIKSLTIAPIQSGFNEYELKMNSMKTIMSSTGASVKEVNGYLNELNKYSDETIYSFSDMTNNIGKFTNAGVGLKDAVNAIKGISSEAALAGANANEASRAMYNFSQALSAGYVKLIDWKSIENANMATKDFKNQLIQTATVLGTVKKVGNGYKTTTTDLNGKVSDLFNSTKNFNDSLSHQWMTTEVLTTTLNAYSHDLVKTKAQIEAMNSSQRKAYYDEKKQFEQDMKRKGFNDKQIKQYEELGHKAMAAAKEINTFSKMVDTLQEAVQSAWAQTSEYIFGTLDQAQKLWTGLESVIENVIMYHNNLRNQILSDWNQLGGRNKLLDAFKNFGKAIKSVFDPIKQAFLDIFHPFGYEDEDNQGSLGKALLGLTDKLNKFAKSIKLTKEESKDVRAAFQGIFAVIKTIIDGVKKAAQIIKNTIGPFVRPALDIILKALGDIGRALVTVMNVLYKVGAVIQYLYHALGIDKVLGYIKNAVLTGLNGVYKSLTGIGDALDKVNSKAQMSATTAAKVAHIIIKCIEAVYMAIGYVIAYVGNAIRVVAIVVGTIGLLIVGGVSAIISKIASTGIIGRFLKWLDKQFTVTAYAADKNNKKIGKSSKSTTKDIQKDWDKLSFKDKAFLVLLGVVEKVKEGFKKFVDLVKEGFTAVTGFFKKFASDVKNYGLGKAILNAFSTVWNGFKDLIANIVSGIQNANIPQPIKNFFTMVGNLIIGIKNAIQSFFTWLGSKLPGLKEIGDAVKKIFNGGDDEKESANAIDKAGKKTDESKGKFDGLRKIVDSLGKAFHALANGVRDFIKSIDIGKLMAFAIVGVLVAMGLAIARLIWSIGSFNNMITMRVGPAVAGLTTSLKIFVDYINLKIQPTIKKFQYKILAIAEAVAILTGCVIALSMIDQNKLWGAVGAVSALALVLVGLTAALEIITSKVMTPDKLAGMQLAITNIIALAASIAGIAIAMKILDSITDTQNLVLKMGTLMLSLASFVAIMTVAQKFWGNGMSVKNTAGVLFFALSLKKIANAMVFIADIDFSKIKKGLGGFTICIIALGALAIAFGKSKWHSGANALGFAISLWLLIVPIKKLAEVDYSHITQALNDLRGTLITLGAIAAGIMVVGALSKKGRSAIHAAGDFVKSLGVAVLSLTVSVGILGKMQRSTLKKGTLTIGARITFLTAALTIASFGSKANTVNASFKSIMSMVLGIGMLVGSVLVLGVVDGATLAKGTAVISALLIAFGFCMKLSSAAQDVKMKPIIAVLASIGTMCAIIVVLGSMPFTSMLQGILGLGAVMGALFILLNFFRSMSISFMGNVHFGKLVISAILTLVAVATTIGVLTAVVSKFGAKNMIAVCVGMASVMIALAVTFGIMQVTGVIGSAAADAIAPILIGLACMAMVALGVLGIVELIGWILNLKDAMNNVDAFVEFVSKMFKAFNPLNLLVDPVVEFFKALKPLKVKQINAAGKVISAIAKLLKSTSGLTGFSSFANIKIFGLLSGDDWAFSSMMENLANGVTAFKDLTAAGGVTDQDVSNFTAALTGFAKIVAATKGLKYGDIERFKDMLDAIAGDYNSSSNAYVDASGNLQTYGTGLGGFAKTFGDTVSQLRAYSFKDSDIDLFEKMISALAEITNIAKEIPNSKSGGFLGETALSTLIGDNRLDDFLLMIAGTDDKSGLGYSLSKAVKAMDDDAINDTNIDKLKNGISALAEVATMSGDIENSGGLLGDILGNNDLGPFLQAIAGDSDNKGGLGDALASAISAMAGADITKDNVDKLKNAVTALVDVANIQGVVGDNSHPILEWMESVLNNKDTFTSFLEALPDMGKNLAAACAAFDKVEYTSVSKMGLALNSLANMMNGLKVTDAGGAESVVSINSFSKDLKKSTEKFQEFSDSVEGLDLDGMKSFGQTVKQMCSDLKIAAGMTKDFAGLGGQLWTIATSMETMNKTSYNWNGAPTKQLSTDADIATRVTSKAQDVRDLTTSLKELGESAKDIDTDAIDKLASSTSGFVTACKSISSAVDGAKKALDDAKADFNTKGGDLMDSFIKGLGSKTQALQDKASTLVTILYNKLNGDGVQKMIDSGKNLLGGIKTGLSDQKYIDKITEQAKTVAQDVVDTTNHTLDEHSPSKVAAKSGRYFLEGIRQGLDDMGVRSKIKKSSKSAASILDDQFRARLQIHSPSKVGESGGKNWLSGILKGITNGSMTDAISGGAKKMAEVINGSFLGKLMDPGKFIEDWKKKGTDKLAGLEKDLTEVLSNATGGFDLSKASSKFYKGIETAANEAAKSSTSKATGVDDLKTDKGKNKKGKNSLGKALANSGGMSEEEIQAVLNAYKKIFYKFTPTLDRFNKKYIDKSGKININYIAHSFLSPLSRRASMYFGKSMAEDINKEFGKYAKKNGLKAGTKAYEKALREFTQKEMREAQDEMNKFYGRIQTIAGKKGLDIIKNSPDLIGRYVKQFTPAADKFKTYVKAGAKDFEVSEKNIGNGLQSLGDYLWQYSDEGIENSKNLKTSINEEAKLRDKMQKEKEKIDKSGDKTTKKQKKEAKDEYNRTAKAMKQAKKNGSYQGKTYKQWEKANKKAKKEYQKFDEQRAHSAKKLSEYEKQWEEQHKKTKEYIDKEAKGANDALKSLKKNMESLLKDYLKLQGSDFTNPLSPFQQKQYSDTEKNFKSGKAAKQIIAYTYTQTQIYKNWEDDMKWIDSGASGLSDQVVKYFQDAGFEAYDELHKLRFATKDEVEEINGYFNDMAQIEKRSYIQKATNKLKAVQNRDANLVELAKSGMLSPEAILDLYNQGMDAADLIDAMADDVKNNSGEFVKQYNQLFVDAGMSKLNDSNYISDSVKTMFEALGYVWDPENQAFKKASETTTDSAKKGGSYVGKVTGEAFLTALDDKLKASGLGDKGRKKIMDALTPIFKDLDVSTDSAGANAFGKYFSDKGGLGALSPLFESIKDDKNKKKITDALQGVISDAFGYYSGSGIDTSAFVKNVADTLSTNGMADVGVKKIQNSLGKIFADLGPMTKDEFADYVSSADGPVAQLCNNLKSEKSKKSLTKAIKTLFKSMYGIDLSEGVFTLTADASTTKTTEDTAENTEKTADSTEDTAKNTKTTADTTKSVESLSAQTAGNTEDIVSNTAKTTDNTAIIASSVQNIDSTLTNSSKSASSDSTSTKYSGTAVMNALYKYFKDSGMGNKGLDHVSKALKPLEGKEYSSIADVKAAITALGLDKEFTADTMKKLSGALDYLDTISSSLVTVASIVDNPKAKTTYKADTTTTTTTTPKTSTTASNSLDGAKVVLDETGKVATNSTVTQDSVDGLKQAIITGLLDPDALSAALHPKVLETGDLYDRVVSLDKTVTQQFQLANQKLDTLHSDNIEMRNTVNGFRGDITAMQNNITNLQTSMSNLKVTMDTGALVGAITPGIDKALGKQASTRRR